MIIDLNKFISQEQPYWEELQAIVDKRDDSTIKEEPLENVQRLYYLYKRACIDLVKLRSDTNEQSLQIYLENLVARAYREIYGTATNKIRIKPIHWFFNVFPYTLRKHKNAFFLSLITVLCGALIGAGILHVDKDSRKVFLPPYLQLSPSERVAKEENVKEDRLKNQKATFSSFLMTHNIRVSIFTFALGITYGVGTIFLLFVNGILIGVVSYDYIAGGQLTFLLGWLLPHGAIEIPSILIAGQAGFVLAQALLGKGDVYRLSQRLKRVSSDIITLILGCAVLLVWAGIIESFLSQYHAPVLPYSFKIAFGFFELALLVVFCVRGGKQLEKSFKLKLSHVN